MALADKMPDLENMTEAEMEAWAASLSPDELMEFMNLLALRQGATEGVTSADSSLELPTIDASKVKIDEPGYVPFGEEGASRSAPKPPPAEPPPPRPASRQEPPARQAPPPPAPTPPAPTPTRREPLRPAASTPPWDVPGARPSAAPSSESQRRPVTPPDTAPAPRPRAVEPPAASIPAQPPAPPPSPPAAAAPPEAEAVDSGALAWLESLAAEQGEDLFNLDLSGISVSGEPEAPAPLDNPMNWLEDLARSQGEQEAPAAFELDTLDEEVVGDSEKIDPFASKADPVTWLETLARRGGADPEELVTSRQLNIPTPPEDKVEPDNYTKFSFETPLSRPRSVDEDRTPVNPSDFLSSLAEGYSEEGVLATQRSNPPEPEAAVDADEGESYSLEEIQDALSKGTVTTDQMQQFLEAQADHLVEHPELLMGDGDESDDEAELIAEIPDWLREMQPLEEQSGPEDNKALEALFEAQGQASAEADVPNWIDGIEQDEDEFQAAAAVAGEAVAGGAAEDAAQSFESLFDAEGQPASLDIPDWLIEADGGMSVEVRDIFAKDDEAPAAPITVNAADDVDPYVIEVDPSDPWVEAFDQELETGEQDPDVVPAWYERNVNDPQRIAAVDQRFGLDVVGDPLAEVPLPAESGLPAGQPQPLPSWVVGIENLTAVAEAAPAADTPFIGDMPEWLQGIEPPDEIPGWLQDIPPVEAPEVFTLELEPEPAPEPEPPRPVAARPAAPPAKPAPQPKPAAVVDDEEAMEVLQAARDLEQAGDLETCLVEYESLIRSNRALETVVEDLTHLVKSYRTVPAVYRVLGDGLMRQGKLQAALDTYRNALNQL